MVRVDELRVGEKSVSAEINLLLKQIREQLALAGQR